MALHILQLGPYPPPEGGVSRNMLAIREELERAGDKCSIVATSKSVHPKEEANVFHPRTPFELLKLVRSIDFDVLHLHVGGDLNPRVLALAFAAGTIAGRKSVLTVHSGAFPLTPEAKMAKPTSARGTIFRKFGAVIAINDDLADVFKRFGVPEERIKNILPFADTRPDLSVELPESLAAIFQDHSPVLLAVGGLEPDYDPLLAVGAMDGILAQLPNASLLLAGDGSMREAVERAVAATSDPSRIHTAGNVEHAVTLHLIERSDMLLRTTLFDGDAISVREALFLGTPVIATDNGMRPEGVHLIPVGDRDELIRAVVKLAKSSKPKGSASQADNSNIRQVIDLYRTLI
jgi:glycogen synthase